MKIVLIFSFLLLNGCAEVQTIAPVQEAKVNNQAESKKQVEKNERELNDKCQTNIEEVEIFQVFEDGALANVCEQNTSFCHGMIVAIPKEKGEELWDKKRIKAPSEKCITINGTYQYTSNDNRNRTVPVIRFDYKYLATSEEEIMKRVDAALGPMNEACLNEAISKSNANVESSATMCRCFVGAMREVAVELASNSIKLESEVFLKKWIKDSEKKCGKSLKDMKWYK